MFFIQFCVFVYAILYACHCHFTGNICENCTQKNEINLEANLDIKNRHEAIISQNTHTSVQHLAKNASKLNADIDKRLNKVIPKKKKRIVTNKSIDNIDKGIKKNYSIFGIDLTLYDLGNKKQLVTKKMINSDDYIENTTDNRNHKELIEDTGEVTIPKNDTVEEQRTIIKNENITENMTKIFQINDIDKTVQKVDTLTNIENNDMTKSFQKYDSPKTKQRNNFIEDSGEFTIPKNDIVEKKSTIINHTNITENVTTIFQNNAMNKNLQKRNIGILENVVHNYNPEFFQNHDANNYQKIYFHKKIENYDTPNNINHNFNADKLYNYQNDEMNSKNIIYKKNMLKKDKDTRRYDDNTSQKVRPQFQTRLNNELVKKSLDEFKMVRRITHFTMPDVEFKTDIDRHEIDYYQDVAYTKFQEYDSEATLNGARNHVKPDHHVGDIRNNMYPTYGEINHIYNSYEDRNEIKNFKELNNLIARQNQIIEKLAKLEMDGRKKNTHHDFDLLMSEVEAKQKIYRKWPNYTDFTFETTTAKTTTEKPTTILTLFDETEVRHALKNDPHVKRILKMANLKREKYLNNVRRYLTRQNYSHDDTEYSKNSAESANGHLAEAEETTSFANRV